MMQGPMVTKSELEAMWNQRYYGGSTLKSLNAALQRRKKFRIQVNARKTTVEKKPVVEYTVYAPDYRSAESKAMHEAKVQYPDANEFQFTRLSS